MTIPLATLAPGRLLTHCTMAVTSCEAPLIVPSAVRTTVWGATAPFVPIMRLMVVVGGVTVMVIRPSMGGGT